MARVTSRVDKYPEPIRSRLIEWSDGMHPVREGHYILHIGVHRAILNGEDPSKVNRSESDVYRHMPGPGTRLMRIIKRDVGERPKRKCGCDDMIRKMNFWGVDGCRDRYELIVSHLVGQTDQLPAAQRYVFKLPGMKKAIAEPKAREWLDEALNQ